MNDEVFQVTLHRTLGRIEGKLDSLGERLDRAQTERDSLNRRVDRLHDEGDALGNRVTKLEGSGTRTAGLAAGVGGGAGFVLNAIWAWASTKLGF